MRFSLEYEQMILFYNQPKKYEKMMLFLEIPKIDAKYNARNCARALENITNRKGD